MSRHSRVNNFRRTCSHGIKEVGSARCSTTGVSAFVDVTSAMTASQSVLFQWLSPESAIVRLLAATSHHRTGPCASHTSPALACRRVERGACGDAGVPARVVLANGLLEVLDAAVEVLEEILGRPVAAAAGRYLARQIGALTSSSRYMTAPPIAGLMPLSRAASTCSAGCSPQPRVP